MPVRAATRRVVSAAVQGDDSFVVLRPFTVGESRAWNRRVEAKAAELRRYQSAVRAAERNGHEPPDPPPDTSFDDNIGLLASHVVEWNWVDDDGKPLVQPARDPAVIDLLTDAEMTFLVSALRGPTEAEAKN